MVELINYFNSIRPLSDEATAGLLRVMKAKELRRGQVWLQEGAVCDKMTFVVHGFLKLYFEERSREVILFFARDNNWILAVQSYYDRLPSKFTIRCSEQSIIVYLLRDELVEMRQKYPELNFHFSKIAQSQAAALEYHTGLLLMTAKERFDRFFRSGSADGLNNKLIAGYLGVSQNSVCNWRKTQD